MSTLLAKSTNDLRSFNGSVTWLLYFGVLCLVARGEYEANASARTPPNPDLYRFYTSTKNPEVLFVERSGSNVINTNTIESDVIIV